MVYPSRLFKFVNNTHKWVEIIWISLGFIVGILFLVTSNLIFLYLLIALLIGLTVFRAFVEYKYDREEKEYMIAIVDVGASIAMSIVIMILLLIFYY